MVAAVFLVVRGKASTGHVCAFLRMTHKFSFADPLEALLFRARGSTAQTDAKIVAQIHMRARAKSSGQISAGFSKQIRPSDGLAHKRPGSQIPENPTTLPII
jgi:hypothetical protein